jgi:hypothetical protein
MSIQAGGHKPKLKFFWARILRDGKTAETQFNVVTGEERSWAPEPDQLTKVMWIPFPQSMINAVQRHGQPVETVGSLPRLTVDLDPEKIFKETRPVSSFFWGCNYQFEEHIRIGDKPVINFQNHLHHTSYYQCKCGNVFQWDQNAYPELQCPKCGMMQQWECQKCGEIKLGQFHCTNPSCGASWVREWPYDPELIPTCPVCLSQTGLIAKGIIIDNPIKEPKDIRKCPICQEQGRVFGLSKIENLELKGISWLETKYILGKNGEELMEWGDEEMKIL